MSRLICTTSLYSLGATFVDWTINFLSGKTEFFNVKENKWLPVSDNPLTAFNAHGHKRSVTCGNTNTIEIVKQLQNLDSEFVSFYANPIRFDQIVAQVQDASVAYIKEQVNLDYAQMLQSCSDNNVPIIFIDILDKDVLYLQTDRSIDSNLLFSKQSPNTLADLKENFINNFCKDSFAGWGTTVEDAPIWVKREVVALNIRPYETSDVRSYITPTTNLLYIEATDLWFNFKEVVNIIFKYLELEIDQSRIVHWENVYEQWSKIHFKNLMLSKYLDYICDSIINNKNTDLSRFDLTFWDEAIIQHMLLFKYNKNINSINLKKFPSNTKHLHKLLTENSHTLEKIY